MTELVCELFVTLDGFARGQRSPGYYGYFGPDVDEWIKTNSAAPHRMLVGRKTYEALNAIPVEVRDDGWKTMAATKGWLFSRTLHSAEWPGLTVAHDDVVNVVRREKAESGSELRTLGSVSLVKQLLTAGLVDRLKLVMCPLVLGKTGIEPLFAGLPDMGLDLVSSKVLDGRVLLLEYRPVGSPPYAS